jgi:hypothetical protein
VSERDERGRFGPGNGYVEKPASGRLASGYRWEPFQPGNTLQLTHGAHHPGTVQPIADAIEATLADSAPWTHAPAFAGTVKSWAYAEAQAALLRSWLDEHGLVDERGDPRPAVGTLGKVEGRLIRLRSELGLSPASLASLLSKASSVARATADDRALEALAAEGRRIAEARALREIGVGDG